MKQNQKRPFMTRKQQTEKQDEKACFTFIKNIHKNKFSLLTSYTLFDNI